MKHQLTLTLLAAALLGAGLHTSANAQSNSEIAAELKRLREELQQVRGELEAVKRQAANPAPASVTTASASVSPGAPQAVDAAPVSSRQAEPSTPALSFFGYGEMTYSRPRSDASAATATLRRGVLGWAYRFNDRTRFAAELEIENAVVSAGDQGEAELEQFYLEHDLRDNLTAKAGLFLMPVGYINEVHEPTRYFGVNRNLIETAIIPSTWRELGLGLRGTTEAGLRWDAGAVTSFDLTKWDATSGDGKASPLGAIHQEGQNAKARNLAFYGALNYNGIPGFNVGTSVFSGGVGQKQASFAAPQASMTLAEVHTRWQPGKWDLSALAAAGRFSNVAALNATFAGLSTPVPDSFGGWYAQAAYRLWQSGDYALSPFTRYERLNTARGYSGLATGLAPSTSPDTRVLTAGANFYLNPQVVLKFDYQRYLSNTALDRLNVGVGFHF